MKLSDFIQQMRGQLDEAKLAGEPSIPNGVVADWLRKLDILAMDFDSGFPLPPEAFPPEGVEPHSVLHKRMRPPFVSHFWQIDGWKCLRVDAPTERFKRNHPFWDPERRVVVERLTGETGKWMRRLKKVTQAHGIEPTSRPIRTYFCPGNVFTFIAWREELQYRGNIHTADADNLIKATYDGLTEWVDEKTGKRHGIWMDDSQVLSILLEKFDQDGSIRTQG